MKCCIILWRSVHDHMGCLFACISNLTSSFSIQSTYTTLPTPFTSIPCTHTSVGKDMKLTGEKKIVTAVLHSTSKAVATHNRWIINYFQMNLYSFSISFPSVISCFTSPISYYQGEDIRFELMHPQSQPACYHSLSEHLNFTNIHSRAMWMFLMLHDHYALHLQPSWLQYSTTQLAHTVQDETHPYYTALT